MPFLIALLVIILIIAIKSIKVVRQSEVYIIERLGKFHKIADAGLTIIIPFFDHVRSVVSLKQQTMDVPPQGVITKDNVTITIDTVVFYKITDPAKAVYEIQSLKKGIEYLAITTIRDIVGKMDLDETFSSRDSINDKLRVILDEATEAVASLSEALEKYSAIQDKLQELSAYYSSEQWCQDFDDDNAGKIPQNLKRGVLSEDAVYNLLADVTRLENWMEKLSAQ